MNDSIEELERIFGVLPEHVIDKINCMKKAKNPEQVISLIESLELQLSSLRKRLERVVELENVDAMIEADKLNLSSVIGSYKNPRQVIALFRSFELRMSSLRRYLEGVVDCGGTLQ